MNGQISRRADHTSLQLGVASTLIIGLYLALLQSGLVSYAGTELGGVILLSRALFLIYGISAVLAIVSVARGYVPLRACAAIGGFVTLALLPLLFCRGEIGPVTKSYVIGLVSIAALSVASMVSDLRRLARFSASIISVASLCCLLDVCFFDGFSNATGRAAFLYINPNVAALALLLGAVASAWSIPLRWLPSFVILVGAAIFATLSRSAMIMGIVTLATCMLLPWNTNRIALAELRAGMKRAIAVGACVLAVLVIALANNVAFSTALGGGFHGIETAVKWIKIGNLIAHSELEVGPEATRAPAPEAMRTPQSTRAAIQVVEKENSASARALLAEHAWHQFVAGPATGIGLDQAFAIAPHNSYLLFADAFGFAGWLIIPGLIALLMFLGGRRALPAATLVAVAAMFSHDLLFAMPLIASFALIVSSVCRSLTDNEISGTKSHVALAAVAITIASICVMADAIEQNHVPSYRKEFSGSDISHLAGHAYYVELPPVTPRGIFRLGAEGREAFRGGGISVLEGSIPLAFGNQPRADIRAEGDGRYGFHNMWVFFSSSDGSNPQTNGRIYHVSADVVIHPLFLPSVLISVLWAAFWAFWAMGISPKGNGSREETPPTIADIMRIS